MDYFTKFIIDNFILLCVGIVVVLNCIQYYHRQKRISLYSILIISGALVLALSRSFELYSRDIKNVTLTTLFSIIGYILRPIILYFFILMNWDNKKTRDVILSSIPFVILAIIYSLSFVPGAKEYVINFTINDQGDVTFGGGWLRFSSHVLAGVYLGWLLVISLSRLRAKHFVHGLAILICALFVIFAVVIETFFDSNNEIYLLNGTIAVAALTHYLFSFIEKTQMDSLTGMYNRETFYRDFPRMDKTTDGIIQFDLNGLKYINDTFGHHEGDVALASISRIILKTANRGMYAYRLGGDEFIVLANNCSVLEMLDIVKRIREQIRETNYYCSIGYAYRQNRDISLKDLSKEAEKMMYEDKTEFYKTAPFKRRKTDS